MSDKSKRKRPKSYYIKCAKKAKYGGGGKNSLVSGLKGFILTCNNREKQCIQEAYNLLNDYADKIYGPEFPSNKDENASFSEDDIEEALQKELDTMKVKNGAERRFQIVESGAKNCLFMKSNVECPRRIVEKIFSDMEEQKEQRTRFLLRMIPVDVTCKAHLDEIEKNVTNMLTNYFVKPEEHEKATFAILYKVRNNGSIGRNEVIPRCAALFRELVANSRTDLVNPDYVVNIDIICSICCLSILPNYYKFKKYNLIEFATSLAKMDAADGGVEENKNDAVKEGGIETEAKIPETDNENNGAVSTVDDAQVDEDDAAKDDGNATGTELLQTDAKGDDGSVVDDDAQAKEEPEV